MSRCSAAQARVPRRCRTQRLSSASSPLPTLKFALRRQRPQITPPTLLRIQRLRHPWERLKRAALASIAKTATQPHSRPSADTEQASKALYEQICQACHASGLMGAPKQCDKAAWAPRLKESMETIYRYALKGKGNMPPKGGSNASDTDVKAAVDYMLKSVK